MPNQSFPFGSGSPKGGGGHGPQMPGGGGKAGPHGPFGGHGAELRVGAPDYIGKLRDVIKECPPGHKFRLYFDGWDDTWELTHGDRVAVLNNVATIPAKVKKQVDCLIARQMVMQGNDVLHMRCVTTSPFTTGLGNEHPLENGFAFLDPYGIPYLPGSSVKGVLRRAAEELALFEKQNNGWSIAAVWWVFGFDFQAAYFRSPLSDEPEVLREEKKRWQTAFRQGLARDQESRFLFEWFCKVFKPSNLTEKKVEDAFQKADQAVIRQIHSRGALICHDVIPRCNNLKLDIMNPHYGHYYQGNEPPGDWGMPIPIFFLTLPVGTEFSFLVQWRPPALWPEKVREYFEGVTHGEPRWKFLVRAAFEFAWNWQGFGAKTAVGYGRFDTREFNSGPQKMGTVNLHDSTHKVPGPSSSRLKAIATLLEGGGPFSKEEVQAVASEICRAYPDQEAVVLARKLWGVVGVNACFASILTSNPIFRDLLTRGGVRL